jgi:transposase
MKTAVIKKALLGEKTQQDIATDAGIGLSTLRAWLKKNRENGNIQLNNKEKRPQDWTTEKRIEALIETGSMSDEERVAWLAGWH